MKVITVLFAVYCCLHSYRALKRTVFVEDPTFSWPFYFVIPALIIGTLNLLMVQFKCHWLIPLLCTLAFAVAQLRFKPEGEYDEKVGRAYGKAYTFFAMPFALTLLFRIAGALDKMHWYKNFYWVLWPILLCLFVAACGIARRIWLKQPDTKPAREKLKAIFSGQNLVIICAVVITAVIWLLILKH